jgi:hypothetical protein
VSPLATILAETDTVLLSFSRGKDSLACWVALLDAGFTVIPYHMMIVPGLEFVEDSLKYYEDFFGAHIYRCIHPNFYHWLRTLSQQTPASAKAIRELGLPRFKYTDIQKGVARTAGLALDTWTAVGTRTADSVMRKMHLERNGGLDHKRRTFSAIASWNKDNIIAALKKHGVKLPIDYALFGRSFDGIDHRFLHPIRQYLPDDYNRILEWFPLAHLEFVRAEFAAKHGQAKAYKAA